MTITFIILLSSFDPGVQRELRLSCMKPSDGLKQLGHSEHTLFIFIFVVSVYVVNKNQRNMRMTCFIMCIMSCPRLDTDGILLHVWPGSVINKWRVIFHHVFLDQNEKAVANYSCCYLKPLTEVCHHHTRLHTLRIPERLFSPTSDQ